MSKRKFPWGPTFVVGFGFFGISILWPIFNQFIPLILQNGNPAFEKNIPNMVGFALSPALAMFIMTWDNIINMFVQPWVGAKSDRTWNRFGRRKIWIIIGAPIAVLGFIFIPLAQSVIAIMVFILITNAGMALFRSPTIAWLGDLFTPDERSKANGVINLMGGVGGLLAFVAGGSLFNKLGIVAPFVAGALAMALGMVVVLIFVKEPRQIAVADEKGQGSVLDNVKMVLRNPDKSGFNVLLAILFWFMAYNALDTSLSSFAVFTLKISAGNAAIYAAAANLSFIAFAIPAGLIAQRIGRRNTIRIGLTGLTILILGAFFIVQEVVSFIIMLVLIGFFWALVNVNSLPMVYDYGDESRIGAYTGLYYFSSQLAAILGPTLGGIIVSLCGNEYRWLFLFSTLFMALAWLVMTGVKERVVPENR